MLGNIEQFCYDDSGAVAADWVVLTGGIVGLGIATLSVVSGSIGNLSGSIASALAGTEVGGLYNNATRALRSFDFTGGSAIGWVGGQVMNMGGQMRELMVLGPGESTSFTLDVPFGATKATMVFDLVSGDSLDNNALWGRDTATVMLNGVPVVIATSGGNMTFAIPQIDGTSVEATVTVAPTQYGGRTHWNDSVAEVTITVNNPTGPIDFRMQSNANQGINDEFWGLDNFRSGTTGAPGF
jgi:Flp pilus assembly pilin Flp